MRCFLSDPVTNGETYFLEKLSKCTGQRIKENGKNNGFYYTWLPLEGLDKGGFGYLNPFRSVRPK